MLVSSTRTRKLAVSALLVFAVGCSGNSDATSSGAALTADGPGGTLSYSDVKVGQIYRMAFPLMKNTSKKPVSVTGVRVRSVPTGVAVLGYFVYSVKDTPGYRLGYQDSNHKGGPDLDKYPNYAGHPFIIKPGVLSDKYAMVHLRVTGKVSKRITGCEVDYTQAGHSYQQTLACTFGFDMK